MRSRFSAPKLAVLILLISPLVAATRQDDRKTLRKARADLRSGRYDSAVTGFKHLIEGKPTRWHYSDLLSQALNESGKPDEALQIVDSFLKAKPEHKAAFGRRARLQFLTDDLKGAVETAKKAPKEYEARVTHAEALIALGNRKDAEKLLEPFVDEYNAVGEELMRNELFHMARGLLLYSELSRNSEIYKQVIRSVISNLLIPDPSDPVIKTFQGYAYLNKHNKPQAQKAFQSAIGANKNYAPALVGIAELQIAANRLTQARQSVKKALDANPNLVDAHYVNALTYVGPAGSDAKKGVEILEKALEKNPNSMKLRGLLAGFAYLAEDQEKYEKETAAVLKINPKSALPYWEAGRLLTRTGFRRLIEANPILKKATEQDPEFWPALIDYGMNCLRVGDEKAGEPILREANKRDPFHIPLQNIVNLLDDFQKEFQLIETDASRVRIADREIHYLKPYVLSLLKRANASLSERYGFKPKVKTLVEVFYSHTDFSVRTMGVPGIGALGACFGQVVTTLSSRARKDVGQPFHWGAVLWHEMAHVYALQLSDYKVPLWFTEGLSTYEESLAAPGWERETELMMMGARRDNKLKGVGGLVRGGGGGRDRILVVYVQGMWIMRHIAEKWKFESIPKLLRAFAAGKKIGPAFEEVLGVNIKDFDEGFFKWLDQTLAESRILLAPKKSDSALRRDSDSNPDDADKAALAALKLIAGNKVKSAKRYARRAVEADPDHALGWAVLGRAQAKAHERGDAVESLRTAVKNGADDYMTWHTLGTVLVEMEEFEEAIKALENAKKCFPRLVDHPGPGPSSYRALNDAYVKTKDYKSAVRVMREMVAVDHIDFNTRIKLARIYMDDEKWDEALAVLDEAAWVKTRDLELHTRIAQAYAGRKDHESALERFKIVLTMLDKGESNDEENDRANVHCDIAGVHLAMGDREKAALHAKEALKVLPGMNRAQELYDRSQE